MGQRLRILDVGIGQGTQALRLARAGHTLTGLESDPAMLKVARDALATEPEGIRERMRLMDGDGRETGAHFLPGSFDVVLCHGVLMYADEPDAMLAGLARMLAPGGLLSLLVRNADALAMRPGLAGDWPGALAAFDSDTYTNRLGLTARADRLEAVTATLAGIAAPCMPGTGCGSSRTTWATTRSCRPPLSWTSCWRPRTAPGGPSRTRTSQRCFICAVYGADAQLRPPGWVFRPGLPLIGGAPQADPTCQKRHYGHGFLPYPWPCP